MLVYVVRLFLQRKDYEQMADVGERMNKVATASALTIIAAGAVLANPGVFMLLAAKGISQLDPTTAQFVIDWALFATSRCCRLACHCYCCCSRPVSSSRAWSPPAAWSNDTAGRSSRSSSSGWLCHSCATGSRASRARTRGRRMLQIVRMGNYAGVDWASEKHDVLICDVAGEELFAATFAHDEAAGGAPQPGRGPPAVPRFGRQV